MTRDQLIRETERLIDEGERLQRSPSLDAMRTWLALSDQLLSEAWGSMDRYHLAWLMVGKSTDAPRGRAFTPDEEARYVRDVSAQKTEVLRTSLNAARTGMPFLGESPA
jgi:hypothetical protein